jgi:two-component system chemotaxis response regulator CheY
LNPTGLTETSNARLDMKQLLDAPRPEAQIYARASAWKKIVTKRILVADDDAMVRASLADVLESEGYLVDEALNGIDAVTRAIKHTPDLVLLDLNMPHWDGWAAFGRLDRVVPLLPVIVITARPNQYQKAVSLGVDAFMEKPLDFPVLLKAIAMLIEEDPAMRVKRVTNRKFVTRLLQTPAKESRS